MSAGGQPAKPGGILSKRAVLRAKRALLEGAALEYGEAHFDAAPVDDGESRYERLGEELLDAALAFYRASKAAE